MAYKAIFRNNHLMAYYEVDDSQIDFKKVFKILPKKIYDKKIRPLYKREKRPDGYYDIRRVYYKKDRRNDLNKVS
jgi:hypothetical protein